MFTETICGSRQGEGGVLGARAGSSHPGISPDPYPGDEATGETRLPGAARSDGWAARES